MFEGIKSGLTAEMIRDRGFEAVPNVIGLPRDWNRYPDDRNDDYVDVRVRGALVRTRAERVVLTAASLLTRTSFRVPDAVQPEREPIEAGEAFALRLPKHSVTVVALDVAQELR